MQNPDKLKFVILGDKGIGKRTLLLNGFGKPGRLSPFYVPIEFVEVNVRGKTRSWDVVCYDSLVSTSMVSKSESGIVESFTASIVQGADAVLFCYAADDASSFCNLANWYKDSSVHLTPNTLLYLTELKTDLDNQINETQLNEFLRNIKFERHYKVCALRQDNVVNMFTEIVGKIESIRSFNQSQLSQNSLKSHSSYGSPDKNKTTGSIQDIRYSDKKEKIILMEGSYSKKLNVVDELKVIMETSIRIQPKRLMDEPVNLKEVDEF